MGSSGYLAAELRRELCARNRVYAQRQGLPHVESYGSEPVIVYLPFRDGQRHGNFIDASYDAILNQPSWRRRLDKVHTQARTSLPKAEHVWRELDSCTSSDALLMNVFCYPGVASSPVVRYLLGVDEQSVPEFGFKARVAIMRGALDRTEVDMKLGSLLLEAKLTESDFQIKDMSFVFGYRDFEEVFNKRLLPRRCWKDRERRTVSAAFEMRSIQIGRRTQPQSSAVQAIGYQLIRNVLAAHATHCSFCVLLDERRPDLIEAWYRVMQSVRLCELRVRCKVLTWQELSAILPQPLQHFLTVKYGISARAVSAASPAFSG